MSGRNALSTAYGRNFISASANISGIFIASGIGIGKKTADQYHQKMISVCFLYS